MSDYQQKIKFNQEHPIKIEPHHETVIHKDVYNRSDINEFIECKKEQATTGGDDKIRAVEPKEFVLIPCTLCSKLFIERRKLEIHLETCFLQETDEISDNKETTKDELIQNIKNKVRKLFPSNTADSKEHKPIKVEPQEVSIEDDEEETILVGNCVKQEFEFIDCNEETITNLEENHDNTKCQELNRIEDRVAAKRAADAERKRRWRERRRAMETPEEAAVRRFREAGHVQRYRARQSLEERESLRVRKVSVMQRIRLNRYTTESPEEATTRRAKEAARVRQLRECKRARETPEEAAARRAEEADRVRAYHSKRRKAKNSNGQTQ